MRIAAICLNLLLLTLAILLALSPLRIMHHWQYLVTLSVLFIAAAAACPLIPRPHDGALDTALLILPPIAYFLALVPGVPAIYFCTVSSLFVMLSDDPDTAPALTHDVHIFFTLLPLAFLGLLFSLTHALIALARRRPRRYRGFPISPSHLPSGTPIA